MVRQLLKNGGLKLWLAEGKIFTEEKMVVEKVAINVVLIQTVRQNIILYMPELTMKSKKNCLKSGLNRLHLYLQES